MDPICGCEGSVEFLLFFGAKHHAVCRKETCFFESSAIQQYDLKPSCSWKHLCSIPFFRLKAATCASLFPSRLHRVGSLEGTQKIGAKTALASLVQEIRATSATQLLTFSIVSPKSDLGFMLLTPDLHTADAFAKQLGLALGPGILTPEFSWLSMTERSESTTSENEYAQTLEKEEKLAPGLPEFEEDVGFSSAHGEVSQRPARANYPRLAGHMLLSDVQTPGVPGQELVCAGFPSRRKLMGGHARVGRLMQDASLQLITGSTGLDDIVAVSLFAKTTSEMKAIVYGNAFR